jgi:hypothetical protein
MLAAAETEENSGYGEYSAGLPLRKLLKWKQIPGYRMNSGGY